MSLINDALKRASQAKPPPSPAAESGAPPLRPAEHKPRASWPVAVFPVAFLVIFGLAGLLLFKRWQANHQLGFRADKMLVAARESKGEEVLNDKPPETLVKAQGAAKQEHGQVSSSQTTPNPSASAPAATLTNANSSKTILAPMTSNGVASAEPPQPTFPSLKLQGIFYRPSNPSALINSKTLYRGDKIANAKVVTIEQDSVTVEWSGQTKVLTLP